MAQSWPEIVQFYGELRGRISSESFVKALVGIEGLASYIAEGPLARALFGFTSMHDLCIRQAPSEADPFERPYLRISPTKAGMVEFRYCDTGVEARQWHREVPPDGVIGRLDAFLDQLHWMPRS